MGWGEPHRPRGAEQMLADGLTIERTPPPPGTLGARLADALGADIIIDLDAVDIGHLVAEHRAAVAEIGRLRDALTGLARALRYDPCLNETADDDPCDCCILACDLARVWADGLVEVRP